MLWVTSSMSLIKFWPPMYHHLHSATRVPDASLWDKTRPLLKPLCPDSIVSLQEVFNFLFGKHDKRQPLDFHFTYSTHKSWGQRMFAIAVLMGIKQPHNSQVCFRESYRSQPLQISIRSLWIYLGATLGSASNRAAVSFREAPKDLLQHSGLFALTFSMFDFTPSPNMSAMYESVWVPSSQERTGKGP